MPWNHESGLRMLAAYRLLPLIQQIYVSFSTMKFFYPVLKMIEEITNLAETKITRPLDKLDFNHDIKFSNISFSYGEKSILNNIKPKMDSYFTSYSNYAILFLKYTKPFYEVVVTGRGAVKKVIETIQNIVSQNTSLRLKTPQQPFR